MADIVQFKLEKMIPELEDLEKKGIFSAAELREIVKKRTDFEYRLKRPGPLKQDFFRYIEYEKQLAALKTLRVRELKRQLKAENKKWKVTVSDKSSNWRIKHIYERMTTKFRGDLNVWFQYAEFCRSIRSSSDVRKVLGKALSFHPKVPALWIYSAAWEFNQNLNPNAARALMLRGLRFCPKSEILWLEYFRMELAFVNKLRARKAAQGLDKISSLSDEEDDKAWKEKYGSLFISLNEEDKADKAEEALKDEKESKDIQEVAKIKELGLKMAHIIFNNAIHAIPSNARFRQKFVEILDISALGKVSALEDEINKSIMEDFPTDENCWDWLARRSFLKFPRKKDLSGDSVMAALNKAIEVYEDALKSVTSPKMFGCYARFLEELIDSGKLESTNDFSFIHNYISSLEELSKSLLKVYGRAENSRCLDEKLAEKYVLFLMRSGDIKAAQSLVVKFCSGEFSKVARLWVLRMSLEIKSMIMKSLGINSKDLQHLLNMFKDVLMTVGLSDSCELWYMAMELFSCKKDSLKQILDLLASKLSLESGRKGGTSLACTVLDWILQNQGIEYARETYNHFLGLPGPSLEYYKHCIMIESQLAAVGCEDARQNMRKLFDSALKIYDQSTDLWIAYCSEELKVGKSDAASMVYWRAKKTLEEPSVFIESFKSIKF